MITNHTTNHGNNGSHTHNGTSNGETHNGNTPAAAPGTVQREPLIRFFNPRELAEYETREDIVLAGDCHITRGEVFVIGGEPGVGKSRAATALAIAGAMGGGEHGYWFGMRIPQPFRTMIIQAENGRYRLQQEYSVQPCGRIAEFIRVSEPPPHGITLNHPEFREDLLAEINRFRPDVVLLDPWNAVARDDKQRDYVETFHALKNILPTGAEKPALGIVAHTRKPQTEDEGNGGTGLMHTLAGSHILSSVPRSVFIMARASVDETDDRVVWFNPKNNNGRNNPRSAWHRSEFGFTPVEDFDWKAFEQGDRKTGRKTVTIEHLHELFENSDCMELAGAVQQLAMIAGIAEKSAYSALNGKGRFAGNLIRNGKMITFKP